MAEYLLDSDAIIDALNRKRQRRELIRDLVAAHQAVGYCSISVTEVYAGLRSEDEAAAEEMFASLDYHEVTWEIARRAGRLKRDYTRQGVTLSLADTTIAAVALAHGLMLVTGNLSDFPMPELRFYPGATR